MAFCIQKSVFSTRIPSLNVSKASPISLCMQNNVISIRITSLYRSQPKSVVFAFKTATLAAELQVSMGPSPHLWFLHAKQRLLDQNFKSRWFPAIICGFVQKTATLSLELLVSMGPSPPLWFLHATQRLYDQKYKSLCVQGLTHLFVHAKQRD